MKIDLYITNVTSISPDGFAKPAMLVNGSCLACYLRLYGTLY